MQDTEVKKIIDERFTGRAVTDDGFCRYLTCDGKKCAIGIFMPDDHEGQKTEASVYTLFREYPDLMGRMPLTSVVNLRIFQTMHDSGHEFKFANLETQKEMLYNKYLELKALE